MGKIPHHPHTESCLYIAIYTPIQKHRSTCSRCCTFHYIRNIAMNLVRQTTELIEKTIK